MTDAFKLTIHMVASLEGIIAKPDNSVSWFETTSNYERGVALTEQEMVDFMQSIDCYVMGANTYEHALQLSENYGWAYGNKPVIVLTHRNLPERTSVDFFSGDLNDLINNRLKPNYKNVWMVGGAMLAKALISQGLADEIRLTIIPIILGNGKLFFDNIGSERRLILKNVTPYKNGTVELHYEIRK